MKYFVNENCIGCGLCADLCPEVFELTDDNVSKAIDSDVDPSMEESANEAMDRCPVNAIENL